MTDADLGELERLARLASAGPWAHHATADSSCVLTGGGLVVCEVAQAFSDNFEDGEFIAAANPAVVLALAAEVRRLRALDGEWYLAARKALADQLVTGLEPGWENIQPDTRDLYEVYRGRRHCDVPEPIVKLICDERDRLRAENDRLKRGDFTPDEFQALCHHLDGTGHCTRAAFEAGCRAYQDKLFGPPPASPAE